MTIATHEAWHPGVLVAGAVHPLCGEWSIRFMAYFMDDVGRGLHPEIQLDQLATVSAMHDAALETDLIIRELTQ
ncbi:hypothetical protein QHH_57 [Halomonas phage QHHSV-1]|nr:hypothetical protein QHH_57 [Halomonas phage QHHSV-1]